MTNKTKKHIGPAAMMSLIVAGLLAVVVALSASPQQVAQAHDCETLTGSDRARCESLHTRDGVDHDADGEDPDNGANGANGGNGGMTGDAMHASMPTDYALQALDNGARLDWDVPDTVATDAEIVGYRIHRDAWNAETRHPINESGDAAFNHISRGGSDTDYSDLGLAYETAYTYQVQAIVEYDVEHWWNNLNCVQMNKVAGSDDEEGEGFCRMYAPLSDEEKTVVRRAYDKYDEMYPPYMSYNRYALGAMSMKRTIETAVSGGRLQALLDPPSAVKNLRLSDSCDDSIVVRWDEPDYYGTVPDTDQNGVYVGPDYIGGQRAGKEEVGKPATSVRYEVERRVSGGSWVLVSHTDMMYADNDVSYGSTYEYRVRSINPQNLKSGWVSKKETLDRPDEVTAPSNLRATLNEDGEVVLQWTAPMGGNQDWFNEDLMDPTVGNGDDSPSLSYRIERVDLGNADTGFGQLTQAHQYGPRSFLTPRITHEQTRTDENPHDGVVTYVVTALVDECLPSPGNSVSLDTQIEEPGAPGNVSAAASGNMITVTWSAPADAGSLGDREATITGYNVERSTTSGSGFEPVEPSHSGTGTSYTDMGLDYSTTYYYRVTAVNSFGAQSAMSAEDSATTAAEMLGMATNLRVGLNTGGAIQVTWDAAQNAAGYIVIAIDKDDTDSAVSGVVNVGPAGLLTTFNLSGLTSGSGYYVYVAATGTAGDNTLSEPVEVTAN